MSYLCTIIEFTHNLCLEDDEINKMFKEIDEINRENIKLENQLEEFDGEHVRLQIELYNLETIVFHNDVTDLENIQKTSIKMYKDSVELKTLIEKIDFTKILQCYHMEMEAKCRKEWQPIQECFVKTLKWHEQMEHRHIVQKYHQAEIVCRQAEEANKNQQESMEKSFKQSLELINQAMKRRNNLIVVLIRGSKDLNDYKSKMKTLNQYQVYIEGLRQQKLKIGKQLEQTQLKAFSPMLNLSSNHNLTSNSKPNTETCNLIMPKLPSFTDILKSFNQTENITSITAIENTTKFCVKSILHTSSGKQSITKKQTKNVRFKVQLEEYREEATENVYNSENENDIEIEEVPLDMDMEINEYQEEKEENLQEMKCLQNDSEIEIVDLLTPVDNLQETFKENEKAVAAAVHNSKTQNDVNNKPLIEIQDCIIFKTPFPVQEVLNVQNKDNSVSDNAETSCSKQSVDTNSSNSSHADIKEVLNTTKKSFYEEFLNISSSSAETASKMPTQSINNNNTQALNDFSTFFNDDKDFLFASKESNEDVKRNETLNNFETKTATTSETQDILDFNSNKGFIFDSDDNMTDNYNAENMDFM